jgi:hypothetical protein
VLDIAVGVFILDAALCLRVPYQLKSASNSVKIQAESYLIVIPSIELDFELRPALENIPV